MNLHQSEISRSASPDNPAPAIENFSRQDALEVAGGSVENQIGALDSALADAPFLIFRLGASVFGVPALAVRTIHALPALSRLQETAPFIAGVFNLRGAIVPVMDLNARFGQHAAPYRLDDSLIVLNWGGAEAAIIVNEVRAVTRIAAAQIDNSPAHGRRHELPEPFVAGVTQIGDGIVMLLHLPHLLGWTESPPPNEFVARFDSQAWTDSEIEVLQRRAAHLRLDSGEARDAQSATESAPVAVVALGGEEFGVELDVVREFASVSAVATVPCCPPHILGQINLRGDIVTLVDVRQTLRTARTSPPFFGANGVVAGHDARGASARPVVVVQHDGAPVGIVVDEVRGVLYLGRGERQALEANAQSGVNGKYFGGCTLHQGRLLPLLDVATLLAEGGLEVEERA